ncbi:PREDICTED: RNA-binding protein 41-like [Nicrophorus vespilloides]|uniref:RNA-binding protein 41-like n=1 Tax=Nicrophorus vespilloides TaxID=110193 RepID=A0ABM1M511_NICVS|nr:PREDICTED: RNA-binding protein 41-like [Nicrophorus vespilloides]
MASFHKRKRLEEFQPPEKEGPSEREILVKQLATKQQNKNIKLKDELLKEKCFIKSRELLPLTNFHAGANNLKGFQDIGEQVKRLEELKHKGLSDEDVKLYLNYQNGIEHVFETYKNYEKSHLMNRIESIVKIVNEDKATIDSNESRIPHPLDNFSEYEKNFMKKINESTEIDVKHIRKKARKLGNRLNNVESRSVESKSCNNEYCGKSKWDVKEIETVNPKIIEKKIYTCMKQQLYTIKNNEIVTVEEAKLVDISDEQLSLEDIKKLAKFLNYAEGEENNILYVKNLQNQIKEKHLLGLFQSNKEVSVKLLDGRMKGQAFITFSDIPTAKAALVKHNGRLINGKPIIIQFGKRKK